MSHSLGCRAVLLVSALSIPVCSEAQTRGFYAGAGVIADNDRTNSRLTDDVAASWALVVGGDITQHMGVRLVFEVPRQARHVSEGLFIRPTSPFPIHETLIRSPGTATWALLADTHWTIAGPLRFAMTYGLAVVRHTAETVLVSEEVRPDGTTSPLPSSRVSSNYRWIGLAFGTEVPITVGRAAIVPEIRMITFPVSDSPHPYITRSGVGVRWGF